MKTVAFILAFIFLFITEAHSQNVPQNWEVISEVKGDLDKDGIDEKVVVYNTKVLTSKSQTGKGYILKFVLYQFVESKWSELLSSKNLLPAYDLLADNVVNLDILNHNLIISHSYRTTSYNIFEEYQFININRNYFLSKIVIQKEPRMFPKEGSEMKFEYDLISASVKYRNEIFKKDKISLLQEEDYVYKSDHLPSLVNFNYGENSIITPKYKAEIWW